MNFNVDIIVIPFINGNNAWAWGWLARVRVNLNLPRGQTHLIHLVSHTHLFLSETLKVNILLLGGTLIHRTTVSPLLQHWHVKQLETLLR